MLELEKIVGHLEDVLALNKQCEVLQPTHVMWLKKVLLSMQHELNRIKLEV